MKVLSKYSAIFALTFIQGLKNYKMLVGLSLFLLTCMVIFSHLWQVTSVKAGKIGYDAALLLWYIAFNEWVLIAIPDVHIDMQYEFNSGSLAYSVTRPINYLGAKFAEGLALLTLQLIVLGLVTFTFTYLWTDKLPFAWHQFGLMLFLGLFAGILGLLFQILVGLSCFWLHDVTPFSWVFEKLLFIFGGLLLPLAVYPEWIQRLASWTPFPAILGGRSSLVFDCSQTSLSIVSWQLAAWLIVSIGAIQLVYRRALKILNVQGG